MHVAARLASYGNGLQWSAYALYMRALTQALQAVEHMDLFSVNLSNASMLRYK